MNPFVSDPEKGLLLPGAAAPAAPAKKWSRAAPLAVLCASLFVLAGVSAASRPAPAVAAPELVDINIPRVPVIEHGRGGGRRRCPGRGRLAVSGRLLPVSDHESDHDIIP